MAASASESMDWLKALEQKVSAVTQEVADLRSKNRSLVSKVNRLEREAREQSAAAREAWTEERGEVRSRVEKLAASLEGLLEEE